jgi:hypothetical protein
MATHDLQARLSRKGANPEEIAEMALQRPALLSQLFDGLSADSVKVRSGCAKVLRLLSIKHPALLYPHVDFFIGLLASPHSFLKWEAIRVVANLAAVDSRGRIEQILDSFLEPIRGPVMITAGNTMDAAATIAQAKPALANSIARAILKVQWADYETEECKNIAFGHAIKALDRIYDLTDSQADILKFARSQTDNSRNATRKKAAEFLEKHTS